jgi:hypothetical protein
MHPSANSLIARKPGFVFALVNGSGIFFALILYLSGTPVNIILFSSVATLVILNALLNFMRRKLASAQAVSPTNKASLYLVLGIFMLGNSIMQIARPRLPSDMPLGILTLIVSPAVWFMAWREFKKPTPKERS